MKTTRMSRTQVRFGNKLFKNKLVLLCLTAALILPLMSGIILPQAAQALGESGWEKVGTSPVISRGGAGAWDSASAGETSVWRDSGTYKMWYSGQDASGVFRIGYATSNDGVTWSKHVSNPRLSPGSTGAWDAGGVASPSVWKDGNTYNMWYMGESANGVVAIGYATSTDGVIWTKNTNPVLTGGSGFEAEGVGSPSVIRDGNSWLMWYTGRSGGGLSGIGTLAIGFATSTDGVTWTKNPVNPVLSAGPLSSWEGRGVGTPAVIKDGLYKMWYTGYNTMDGITTSKVGYASSSDGIVWNRAASNPSVSTGATSSWEGRGVGGVSVVNDSGVYRMWYSGLDSNLAATTGLATIPTYTAQTTAAMFQDATTFRIKVNHNITGITSSGGGSGPGDGIANFGAKATYTVAGINILDVSTAAPFTGGGSIDNTGGEAMYGGGQSGSAPQAPLTLATITPRLVGSKDDSYTLTLKLDSMESVGHVPVVQAADASLTGIRRGDANKSTTVSIIDALFIAQYLAQIRPIADLNPLNAASVRYDGTTGDGITIQDAMFIAQMLAFLRDASYNLI